MDVSVHGAKTQWSTLLDLVEDDEEVVFELLDEPIREYSVGTIW